MHFLFTNMCIPTTHVRIFLILITLLCFRAGAQQNISIPDWSAFQFLLGEWTCEGSGIFSFSYDLQDHILIRRSQSDYPETKTHADFSHNDLMVIFQKPGQSMRAIYFDNEGHTIHYNINISGRGKSVTFISDSLPSIPRFQLSYTSLSVDSLRMTFEIAPPSEPKKFSRYLEGKAHRT